MLRRAVAHILRESGNHAIGIIWAWRVLSDHTHALVRPEVEWNVRRIARNLFNYDPGLTTLVPILGDPSMMGHRSSPAGPTTHLSETETFQRSRRKPRKRARFAPRGESLASENGAKRENAWRGLRRVLKIFRV